MYRILLVDDHMVFRKRIRSFPLWGEQSDFVIAAEAQNGREALELAAAEPFELIITDIKMPIIDGLGLLREVKRQKLCPCVVLLSEYCDFQYAREGLVLGAFDYLVKPVEEQNLQEMLSRVAGFLTKSESAQELHSEAALLAGAILEISPQAPELARQLFERLYAGQDRELLATGVALSRLMDSVFHQLFEQLPWLELYCSRSSFSGSHKEKFEDITVLKSSFESAVRELLVLLSKLRVSTGSQLVDKAAEHVLLHPEDDLSLQRVAEQVYANHTYLSSLFKRSTGSSFVDYVNLVRIERAKLLLSCGKSRVAEVAERLGYSDPEYFSQMFRQATGIKPSSFQRQDALQGPKIFRATSKDFQ